MYADLYSKALTDQVAHLKLLCNDAASKTNDRPLQALGAALVAKVMATQGDSRHARRFLRTAIALDEKSKDDATILFPGEVAEAIQNAKQVIAQGINSRIIYAAPVNHWARTVVPPLVAALIALLLGWVLGASRAPIHCFHKGNGTTVCAESLEHCEKLRAVAGQASSGPCQKPQFAPSP